MAVPEIIAEFRHEIVVSVLVSVLLGVIVWPFRKARAVWEETQGKLDAVAAELSVQRTNCLATLQSQGDKQIELLGKTVSTLEAIHLSQAEMSGYLKAK